MNIDYPLAFDHRHRTAETTDEDHIRDLIEQVLFTSPGERVNRPDFGSGLLQLVFAPNSEVLAAATQATVQASLQHFLGDRILVDAVEVTAADATLEVAVRYTIRGTEGSRTDTFVREL